MFHVVLVHPDIPQNTGNISRLCVGANAVLHLVKPMSFVIDDRKVRRAGLDYWPHLQLIEHDSLDDFLSKYPNHRMHFFTTKTEQVYTKAEFHDGDFLVFGSESRGLPEALLNRFASQTLTIPMPGEVRSMNLSNAAAVALYEAMRQTGLGT